MDETLKLRVTNLGPIVEADIDLRPLTVFVGPSNTGKSYLAMLIYALHSAFSGSSYLPFRYVGRTQRTRYILRSQAFRDMNIQEATIEDLGNWLESDVWESGTATAISRSMPDSVARLLRHYLEDTTDLREAIVEEIKRCFGLDDISQLIRRVHNLDEAKVLIEGYTSGKNGHKAYEYILSIGKKSENLSFQSKISKKVPFKIAGLANKVFRSRIRSPILDLTDIQERKQSARETLRELARRIVTTQLLNQRAHYLPADRTGVMHSHRVVVSSLISRASQAGLHREQRLPEFSGVIADFLQVLVSLGEHRYGRRGKKYMELANRIQTEMLGGAIEVESSAVGYPDFYYKPAGWNTTMPLMNASSMVSELAPVVLYLREKVQKDEVLIIEEPESHLHPKMQVELTYLLAAAVHAGVRVVITTHSEWVLEALANLILVSDLPKEQRKGIPSAEFALSSKDVGVWFFEPKQRPKGSIVKELKMRREDGGFLTDYEDVAIGTHNHWATIISRLERSKLG